MNNKTNKMEKQNMQNLKKELSTRVTIVNIAHKGNKKKLKAVRDEIAAEAFKAIVEGTGSNAINFTHDFSVITENRELFEHLMHWDGHEQFSPAAFDVLWSIHGMASVKMTKGSNSVRVNKSKEDTIKGDSRTVFWVMADKVEEFLNKNDLVIGE